MNQSARLGTALLCAVLCGSAGAAELLGQGFEDSAYFAQRNDGGYTAKAADGTFWWGVDAAAGIGCGDEQAAMGRQSLKFTYREGRQPYPAGHFAKPSGESLRFEAWCYREDGFRFVVALAGPAGEKRSVDLGAVGVFDANAQFVFMDNETGKWQRTGLKCPVDQWFGLALVVDREAGRMRCYAVLDEREELLGQTILPPDALAARVELRRIPSAPGSSGFFDEMRVLAPPPATVPDEPGPPAS